MLHRHIHLFCQRNMLQNVHEPTLPSVHCSGHQLTADIQTLQIQAAQFVNLLKWSSVFLPSSILATSGYNSINLVSQSEGRIQILMLFDWMAWFSLLQPDVVSTWKSTVLWLTCTEIFRLRSFKKLAHVQGMETTLYAWSPKPGITKLLRVC